MSFLTFRCHIIPPSCTPLANQDSGSPVTSNPWPVSIIPKSTEAPLGTRLTLTCLVEGSAPPSRIDWIHGQVPVNSSLSSKWIIKSVSIRISRLIVSALRPEHAGMYTCRAIWPARSFQEVAFIKLRGNVVAIHHRNVLLLPFFGVASDFSCSLPGVVIAIPFGYGMKKAFPPALERKNVLFSVPSGVPLSGLCLNHWKKGSLSWRATVFPEIGLQ